MTKNHFYLLIAIVLLGACQENKKATKKIDYTPAYKFTSEIEADLEKDTLAWKHQVSAQEFANNGQYKNALIHWDLAMPTKERSYTKTEIDSINAKYSKVNAADYIIQEAKQHQIVIINEAHHNASHRVFTKSLLQALFDQGYKNLGLEAMGIGVDIESGLNERKYPVLNTGYYIKDPQFGNLIREALAIGYEVFGYENEAGGSGSPREIGQAKNIQQVIEAKPNEKFLIHCGFAHAMEGEYRPWGKAMAGRLTEFTGIDPLTINQEMYSEKSKEEFNRPLLKAFDILEPTVLLDHENKPLKYERHEAWTDIAVLHPNTTYIEERPDWLFKNGNRKVAIPMQDIQLEFPVMVLAYKKGEDLDQAIPVDLKEIKNKDTPCHLALPKGEYDIVVTNQTSAMLFEQKVE